MCGHTLRIVAYTGVQLRGILGASVSVVLALSCGGKSEDANGTLSPGTGGNVASTLATAQGGQNATGGEFTTLASGGTHAAETSPQSIMGGTASTKPNTAGGTQSTGGMWTTGGKAATGGTLTTGGAASIAGGSPSGGNAGTGSTGGVSLTDFCTGSEAKVRYQGQELSAPATNYVPEMILECCMSYGVNFHSVPALGFDLDAEIIWALDDVTPGVFEVGAAFRPFRAVAYKSTDTAYGPSYSANGTVELFTDISFDKPWEAGLCLEVSDTTSTLLGARFYVPRVTITSFSSASRFQIFLLSDSAVTPAQASAQALDSLTLEAYPLLDLGDIAYVDESSGEIGLNPRKKYGDSLRSSITLSVQGLPFVVVADGVRIYLGTFMTMASSIGPVGPSITVEDIASQSLVIQAPWSGADPRNDSRIIATLTAAGKLIF
jgi:hypothetical protein